MATAQALRAWFSTVKRLSYKSSWDALMIGDGTLVTNNGFALFALDHEFAIISR